jgi:hypothetical protein
MKLNKIYSQFYRKISPFEERGLKLYALLETEGYDISFISGCAETRDHALYILEKILRGEK